MAAGVEFELKQSDIIKAYNLCKKANVPIIKLGAYLDGYDKGIEVLDKIRDEIDALLKVYPFVDHYNAYVKVDDVKKIIDKYIEREDKE